MPVIVNVRSEDRILGPGLARLTEAITARIFASDAPIASMPA